MSDKQRIIEDLEDLKYLLQKPKNIEIARTMIESMIAYLTTIHQTGETLNESASNPLTLEEERELRDLNEYFRTAHNLHISDKMIARAKHLENRQNKCGAAK